MRLPSLVLLGIASTTLVSGQGRGPAQPPPPPVNASADPLLRGFEFRSIGPATMMGRVDDIAGAEKDPMTVYVGFATGGLWKSTDGGNHWKSHVRQPCRTNSIGAIAIAPSDPNIVYVGTGEANNRQSSSIGDGMWGTTDGGQHWTHLGLDDTQSIARIAVDPTNPNIVYVAAMGHLFGPNPERGLYKSVDGGKTWKKAKFIDTNTGLHRPRDRSRRIRRSSTPRPTSGSAPGGATTAAVRAAGCGRSTDGGETWTQARRAGLAEAEGRHLRPHRDLDLPREAQRRFTRRSKSARAAARAAARRRKAVRRAADAAAVAGESAAAEAAAPGGVAPPGGAAAAGNAAAGGGGRWRRAAVDAAVRRAASRSEQERRLPLRRRRQDLDVHEQSEPASDVLQPDPRGSGERPEALRRRQSRPDLARTAARPGRGITGSHTDYHAFWINPEGSAHRLRRPRRRPRHQQRRRPDLGLSQRHRGRASSIRCRPTCAVLITSAAACRTTTPGADRARCGRPPAR